eukprot:scaffold2299_cov205-Pinguiococcus_pyrenoidosus.AAC.2
MHADPHLCCSPGNDHVSADRRGGHHRPLLSSERRQPGGQGAPRVRTVEAEVKTSPAVRDVLAQYVRPDFPPVCLVRKHLDRQAVGKVPGTSIALRSVIDSRSAIWVKVALPPPREPEDGERPSEDDAIAPTSRTSDDTDKLRVPALYELGREQLGWFALEGGDQEESGREKPLWAASVLGGPAVFQQEVEALRTTSIERSRNPVDAKVAKRRKTTMTVKSNRASRRPGKPAACSVPPRKLSKLFLQAQRQTKTEASSETRRRFFFLGCFSGRKPATLGKAKEDPSSAYVGTWLLATRTACWTIRPNSRCLLDHQRRGRDRTSVKLDRSIEANRYGSEAPTFANRDDSPVDPRRSRRALQRFRRSDGLAPRRDAPLLTLDSLDNLRRLLDKSQREDVPAHEAPRFLEDDADVLHRKPLVVLARDVAQAGEHGFQVRVEVDGLEAALEAQGIDAQAAQPVARAGDLGQSFEVADKLLQVLVGHSGAGKQRPILQQRIVDQLVEGGVAVDGAQLDRFTAAAEVVVGVCVDAQLVGKVFHVLGKNPALQIPRWVTVCGFPC